MNIGLARIGLVSISDRASGGIYQDRGIPALREWLTPVLATPWEAIPRLIPDEAELIEHTLLELTDIEPCALVFTTGGTGPAPRDLTPDVTLKIADRVLDGFGERMRAISLRYVPTAILSRQVGVIRKQTLIINLPGQPKAIRQILDELFPSIPYCIDLIGGPRLETREGTISVFRPGEPASLPAPNPAAN